MPTEFRIKAIQMDWRFTLSLTWQNCVTNRFKRVFVRIKKTRCRSFECSVFFTETAIRFLSWCSSRTLAVFQTSFFSYLCNKKTILQINMIGNFFSDGCLTVIQSTKSRQGTMWFDSAVLFIVSRTWNNQSACIRWSLRRVPWLMTQLMRRQQFNIADICCRVCDDLCISACQRVFLLQSALPKTLGFSNVFTNHYIYIYISSQMRISSHSHVYVLSRNEGAEVVNLTRCLVMSSFLWS